ncbi:polyamine-modulated factor 1-binding protein 1-like [Canna indica]|uniref:Polyamine-modulated factor 1-binding protein 1-like n=1 Tax=Canna indica TaxID=4628 RepID=A0AAQ3QA24_9LILI|nr:polyamine-modulated factor 1-binding protein 1-like [Canna indica]
MACGAMRSWNLASLVSAFLDLALAHLFLTAAALAFLASKFLALFGLTLPCSCRDGLEPGCLPSLLADYPARKVFDVHLALRERYPFDSACRRCRCCCCGNAELECGKKGDFGPVTRRLLDMEVGEGDEPFDVSRSCASNSNMLATNQSDEFQSRDSLGRDQMGVITGKEILRAEIPPVLLHRRRRRKNILVIKRKSSHASSTPPLQLRCQKRESDGTPFSCNIKQLTSEDNPSPGFTPVGDRLSGNQIGLAERDASDKSLKRSASCGTKHVCESINCEATITSDLKQTLEEERSARIALYLELEKERSAAATAAEEALAMILRLQEEKAAIEMEARQFQRMVEEKSAYDEEEMEILKEIILRREMEKHVLGKEVETYRSLMLRDGDAIQRIENCFLEVAQPLQENHYCSLDSSDDLEQVSIEVYPNIEKKENMKDNIQCVNDCVSLVTSHNKALSHCMAEDDFKKCHNIEELHPNRLDQGSECNVQDKSMVTMEMLSSSQKETSGYGKELTSHSNDEEDSSKTTLFMRHSQDTIETYTESSQLESDASVIDLHIIDDKIDMGEHGNNELLIGSRTNTVDLSTPDSALRCTSIKSTIHRSCSDMIKARHSIDGSCRRPSWLGLRRSSMSSVDNERFKLENEVEILRNRLKLIQHGREKLNLSVEQRENESQQREKESQHLQLLEEISLQLQEIRKVVEPGTSTRQSSLPPSCKVNLRRRHSVCTT